MPTLKQQGFMQSAPIVAKVFGNKYGVTIEYGHEPQTDGKTIFLPTIPFDASQKVIQLMNGYLDHETAHIRYTDMDVYNSAYLTGVYKTVKNLIEDTWIEEKHAVNFPGCRINLDNAIRNIIDDNDYFSCIETPASALCAFVGSWGRLHVRKQKILQSILDIATVKFREFFGEMGLFKIDALLSSEFHKVSSTEKSLRLTALIERAICDIEEEIKAPQDDQKIPPSGPNTGDRLESDIQVSTLPIKDSGIEEVSDPFDFGKALSIACGDHSKNQDGGSNSGLSTKQLLPTVVRSGTTNVASYVEAEKKVSNAVQHIQQQLEMMVSLKRRPYKKSTSTGRIKTRKVSRLIVGDNKVFSRKYKRNEFVEPAISLLIDASSSMSGSVSLLALSTAIAIGESCHRLNIPFEVSAFSGSNKTADNLIIKAFDTSYEEAIEQLGGYTNAIKGSTPLTEALIETAIRLLLRTETNRTLIVITDGEPNNKASCLEICQRLETELTLIGVGVATNSVMQFFSTHVVVNDVDNIGLQVIEALRQSILHAA